MTLDDDARLELEELQRGHRRRHPRVVDGAQGSLIQLDGRNVINFSSNDYLGLAAHPRVAQAAKTSIDANGVGAGASRLVVGNHREHVQLELALADWLQCGGVRLFSAGYAANIGALTALLGLGDVVFSDELNHASIIDGCRLSRARIVVYPHRDLNALEKCLQLCEGRRRLIVSESLFSMDGDTTDVEQLSQLATRYGAAWMLDEAHAIGVLGPEGRGIAAGCDVVPDLLIGTLGKAFGSAGAFVATRAGVADLLWNRARSFVFSTGMPPAIAAAGMAGLEIIAGSEGRALRARLQDNIAGLRMATGGLLAGNRDSPIAPLMVGDDERATKISCLWLEAGVFVQAIRPPTVAVGAARLRISTSAAHSKGQIHQLTELIRST